MTTRPAEEEATPEAHGFLWWAIGGAIGTTAAVVLAVIVLAVWGSASTESPGAAPSPSPSVPLGAGAATLALEATEFAYDPNSAVGTGELEIALDNQGLVLHNLVIEGVDGFVIQAEPGQVAAGRVSLPAGTYTYFCSIPGHREAGMEGQLTISG